MDSLTLARLLKKAALEFPSLRALLVSGKFDVTNARFNHFVDPAASRLLAAGVTPGHVVALIFPSTPELVVVFLAVIRCRATAAPLNMPYKAEEFELYISDSETKRLITGNDGNKSAESTASELRILHLIAAALNDGESELSLFSSLDVTAKSNAVAGISSDPSDVVFFLHTSRTTSRPEGVVITQLKLASWVRNIGSAYKFSELDSAVLVLPLFHVHGLIAGLLSSLVAGAAVGLSMTTFWPDVRAYTAVPTIHLMSTTELVTRRRWAPVLEAYAMTEASHQMATNPLLEDGGHKPGSVCKPVGLEMVILKTNGMPVREGVSGEVCIREPNLTKDYRNSPEANKAAFLFGWFHTGDVGFLDSDGYLRLVGRVKEPINRGGENISAIEVDAGLLSHHDARQAVAFGVLEDKYRKEALGYTMAAMTGHDINDSPALEVGMATGVSITRGCDIEAADAVSLDVEITIDTGTSEGCCNIEAVDVHPREENQEGVITISYLPKKIGPLGLWALGCTLTAIAAATGLPIFGHRFTPGICAAVMAGTLFRVLARYLVLEKCIPKNLDLQEMSEIRIDVSEGD